MTILIFNIGDPVFLRTRKQVRPPQRSKLAIYQDERFDSDWDRLIKWDDVEAEPIDVMNAYGIEALWTGTFDWSDQPQPEFVASDLFHEHFNTGWFQTNVAPEGALVVDGVAEYQQTLTANVSALADEDVLPDSSTYLYQWQHETSPDVFEDLAGETGTSYTTDRYDMGKRIRFRLQYTDLLLNDETVYSVATSVIPYTDIPVEGTPFIQNLTAPGQGAQQTHNLFANVSNVFDFNQPISDYSYQWFREDALNSGNYVEISGATAQNYAVQAEDLHPAAVPTNTASSGGRVKVRVQYTDNLGKLEEVFSAPFAVVDSPFSGTPTIDLTLLDENGNPTTPTTIFDVDTRASANLSSFQDANDPLTYEYQWYAEVYGSPGTFLPITGATQETFDITNEYQKRKLYVRVTTTDASGNVYVSQSAQTARVNSLPEGAPSITGTFQVDQLIEATDGSLEDYDTTISNVSKFYEYYSADSVDGPWTSIRSNDSTPTYTIQKADINKQIRVRVSYTDSLGKLESVYSPPVLVVNTLPVGIPVITGTFEVDETLTADMTGVSDDNTPIGAYSYQWFIKDPYGANTYSEISGATSSTYTVQFNDVHQDIKVEASFTDSGGVTETVISEAIRIYDSHPTGSVSAYVVEGGDPVVGSTLQLDTSAVADPNGVGPFSYQWYQKDNYKGGSTHQAIPGATGESYLLTEGDKGYEVYGQATYTDLSPRNAQTYSFSSSAGTITADPYAIYRFEDSLEFVDQSGNQHHGGFYSVGDVNPTYNAGSDSVSLNGGYTSGSYVKVPSLYGTANNTSQVHPKFSNGISVAFWHYNVSSPYYRGLVNTGFGSTDAARQGSFDVRYTGNGKIIAYVNRYTSTEMSRQPLTTIPEGWNHIAVTFDNNWLRIYLNGVRIGQVWGTTRPIYNTQGFNIGSSGPGVIEFLNGELADIFIFDRAISQDDILGLYGLRSQQYKGIAGNANFLIKGGSPLYVKAPVTGQPIISGRPTVDAIISSDVSAIADLNGLNTFSYQWLRDGAPISDATGTTYTVQDADFEKNITLRVSYTDRAGYSETPTSDPLYITSRPPAGSISITNTTSLGNSPQVTHVLEGDWSALSDADGIQPANVTYYWYSNNVEVQSGTGDVFKQYTVQPSDYGQSIVLKISYTDDLGNVEDFNTYAWLTSAGVTVVNSPVTGEVYVLNAQLEQASQEEQGAVLTADPSALRDINEYDDLTPDSFTYQWLDNGVEIAGATGQSYTLKWTDNNISLSVRVSFTDDEGNVETVVSSNSVTMKNSLPTGDVVISGEPRVGKALTADPSSIADPNHLAPITKHVVYSNLNLNGFGIGWASAPVSRSILTANPSQNNPFSGNHYAYFNEPVYVSEFLIVGLRGDNVQISYLNSEDVWVEFFSADSLRSSLDGTITTFDEPLLFKAVRFSATAYLSGNSTYGYYYDYLGWFAFDGPTRISAAARYQWYRDDGNGPVDIAGATSSTYTLVEADYAKNITCTVSYTDLHGHAESVTSSIPVLVDAKGYPSIDGAGAAPGEVLTANLSAMQDVQGFNNLVYHWEAKQLDDADYSVVSEGADQNTFTIPVGYDAAQIRLRVTYDDGDFATSDFVYVRSDVTGDLVMSGPSSPDYYVNDVVLADARNIEDINGLPANNQINYNWYRGADVVSTKTQSVIYEQAITVTSNSAISNHLVEVTLNTAALISAGKMHSDSYVHFYDEAGNKIPYWFEGPANDARSTYWLKMDLPAGSASIVARYCADADFAKFSSDASVMGFTFFEDFENGFENWTFEGSSDAFQQYEGGLSGNRTSGYAQSVAKYSSPIIARAVSITTDSPTNGYTPLGFWNSISDQVSIIDHNGTSYYKNNGSNQVGFTFDGEGSGFIKDEIILTGTQAQVTRISATQNYSSGFFAHTQGNKPLFLGARPDLGSMWDNHSTNDSYLNQVYSTSWRFIHVRPYVAGLSVSVSLGSETSFVGSVYNIDITDGGSNLHVVMSYTDLQGYSESVTSPTITVSNSPFYGAIKIVGSPYTGQTLSVDNNVYDLDGLDGATYAYQWYANGQALTGETASTFVVTNAYVNQVITVDFSFTDILGSSGSVTSAGVTILNTPSTGEPVLNGTASVGEALSIDMASVADVDGPISNVTYAWYESTARNVLASRDTLIVGAESDTFTIPAGYEAKEVKALVSYDDTKGESKSRYAPAPAFPEQDLDFYLDAGSKDSYALGTTDVYDLTQDALAMTVASNEWSNINNGRFASSTTKRALQNASRLHDLGNDFTISALAYINPSVDNVFLSCMQYNSGAEWYEGYMFYFDAAQDRLALRLGAPGVTNNSQGVFYFRSGGQITGSGFYLVSVAVQNYNSVNPTVDFFVNGNLSGSKVLGDGTFHSAIYYDEWNQRVRQPLYADVSEPVLLGGMNNSGYRGYGSQNFDIGMLSVHRRALSDAEMAEMYSTFSDRITGSVSRKLIAAPPVGAVTISGTPQAGSTLTADASSITDQNEIVSLLITWHANGSQIGTGATRTLTTSEFNKQVTVKASYTDRAGYSHEVESAPVQIVNTPATGTVAISGTPEVGQELTAVTSAISDVNGKPVNAEDFTYQWYVDTVPVATGATYTVQTSDIFKDIYVDVSFTDNQGNAEGPFTSLPVSIVNSEPQGVFEIQGGTNAGDLVYVDVSGITDANGIGNDWSYQWKRNGIAIPGATNPEYVLQAQDLTYLEAHASYTDQAGTREYLFDNLAFEGLHLSEYVTSYTELEDIVNNIVSIRQTAGRSDFSNQTSTDNFSGSGGTTAFEYVGYFKPTVTGTYTFGDAFWIGNAAMSQPSWATKTTSAYLSKELVYPVRVISTFSYAENQTYSYPTPANIAHRNSYSASYPNNFYYLNVPHYGIAQSVSVNVLMWNSNVSSVNGTNDIQISNPQGQTLQSGRPYGAVIPFSYVNNNYNAQVKGSWTLYIRSYETYNWGILQSFTATFSGMFAKWFYTPPSSEPTVDGTGVYFGGAVAHNSWQEQYGLSGTVSIAGAPGEDHTLSPNLAGDWAAEASHTDRWTYQWTMDGEDLFGETHSTFIVPGGKAGSLIGLRVGYLSESGNLSSAEATPVVILANSPPLGVLNVSGELFANRTLTVDPQFTDVEGIDEATRVYTWYRNDAAHATGTSYTTVEADIDATFYVEASYTDNEGEAHTISSDPFTIVNAAPVGSVTISGLYVFGQTLTATVNVSDPDGIAPNTTVYQWVRNGNVDIPGANALSYTLGADDVNQNVSMDVRYTDIVGKAEVVSSASSFVVGRPPTVDNPLEDQETYEGLDFSFTVPANTFSDPDGDPFTFSASLADDSALPAWISFNEGTQEFAGTAPTGFASQDFKVTVDDTFYQTSDEFTLFVRPRLLESFEYNAETGWPGALPEGEPNPGFNYSSVSANFEPAGGWPTAPQINGSETLSVLENIDAATVLAVYTEANALAVTWSVAGTDAARFQIDAATGELRFLASPDFEVPLDANTDNEYQLGVIATDAFGNANVKAVSITVTDADEIPPEISGEDTPGAYEGHTAVATYTANEPVVAWTLAGPDAGFFDLVGGVLSFKVAPTDGAAADSDGDDIYEVTVQAEDVAGNLGEKPVLVEVFDASPITDSLTVYVDASSGSVSDLSGNGTSTSLVDGAWISGGTFNFDGVNDRLYVNNPAAMKWTVGGLAKTVEVWVKTADTAGSIISKPWNWNGEYNYRATHDWFGVYVGTNSSFNFPSVADNQWHQMVVFMDSTKIGISIDGGSYFHEQNHNLPNTSRSDSNLPLLIMSLFPYSSGWGGNTGYSMSGQVGLVRHYTKKLSQTEIAQSFHAYKSRFGL